MSIHDKNTSLLFLTTFCATKNFFKFDKLLTGTFTKVYAWEVGKKIKTWRNNFNIVLFAYKINWLVNPYEFFHHFLRFRYFN